LNKGSKYANLILEDYLHGNIGKIIAKRALRAILYNLSKGRNQQWYPIDMLTNSIIILSSRQRATYGTIAYAHIHSFEN